MGKEDRASMDSYFCKNKLKELGVSKNKIDAISKNLEQIRNTANSHKHYSRGVNSLDSLPRNWHPLEDLIIACLEELLKKRN